MEEEDLIEKGFDTKLLGRLMAFLQPYWRWVALSFGLILLTSVVRQAGPYLTKVAVDDYIVTGDLAGLKNIVLLFLALLVAQFFFGYVQSFTAQIVGQWAMRDVRLRIFAHLQRLPLHFFDRTPVGQLMTRTTNDVEALNEFFTRGATALCSDVFTIVTILGYIFYMDVELGLVTCAVLPLATATIFWLHRRTFHSFRRARTRLARFNAHLQETIAGMEVVHLFKCEQRSVDRMGRANDEYLDARLEHTLYHSIYFPFMEVSGLLLTALVLWYGAGEVLQEQAEWGVLVAMLQYVPRFFMPIRDIADGFSTIQMAMASSERIFELFASEPEPEGGNVRLERMQGTIEFSHVWFAYAEEEWVLRDVSFRAESGQSLALVGATGAGKSTIVHLVCRFYEIQRGSILVDGVDIRQWDMGALRRRIGIVPQDVFLFSGDVESNIRLGAPQLSSQEVEDAARHVNADRFIRALPDGYAHAVNERGTSFSTGQRQLLSFARALAAAPDILVLDEATANVDTETEMLIQEAVEKLMRERTSIVIAHRLSTISHADKILVMHRGQVREEGRHEELLAKGGIYYRLHQLQYRET